jgi:hypothetical protein
VLHPALRTHEARQAAAIIAHIQRHPGRAERVDYQTALRSAARQWFLDVTRLPSRAHLQCKKKAKNKSRRKMKQQEQKIVT